MNAARTAQQYAHTEEQYYVAAEIKPNGHIDVVRIESTLTLEHTHVGACEHVKFMRHVNQRKPPYGKLETKPLLRALAAWPLAVLKTIAGMRHGFLGQETADMARGLKDDGTGLVAAVNRCALNEASDDDRVLLARKNKSGDTMLGPCELVECSKHPGQHELHRWTWDVPSDGDHRSAIECGDADLVRSCPTCIEEDEIDSE
jgi:hypothetical protein